MFLIVRSGDVSASLKGVEMFLIVRSGDVSASLYGVEMLLPHCKEW